MMRIGFVGKSWADAGFAREPVSEETEVVNLLAALLDNGVLYVATGDNYSYPATATSDAVMARSIASSFSVAAVAALSGGENRAPEDAGRRIFGVAIGMPRISLKSVNPLLPPKPMSLRKNASIKA